MQEYYHKFESLKLSILNYKWSKVKISFFTQWRDLSFYLTLITKQIQEEIEISNTHKKYRCWTTNLKFSIKKISGSGGFIG